MSWAHIRGHDSLRQSFADVVRSGRLGHAYLFAGPEGVGKRLFARELAKALLCPNADAELNACDHCPSCRQADAGTHPDLILASRPEDRVEFPIDVMRELSRRVHLTAAMGGFKIAIIDHADDFNDESANAFLKTLEEPPANSLLILLAADPDSQKPTILSRCQLVRFRPLPEAEVRMVLRAHEVAAEHVDRLARLGGGSPGQALALADDALWAFRANMLAELSKPKSNTVRFVKEWETFVQAAGKDGGAQRRRAALCLRLWIDALEAALRMKAGVDVGEVDPADRDALRRLADRYSDDHLLHLLEQCLDGQRQIDRLAQLVLVLESLADRFA